MQRLPKGYSQAISGTTYCMPCFGGEHQDETGAVACKDCQANTYSDGSNSSNCKTCPTGFSSGDGATFCSACDAGKYMNSDSVCESCPAGWSSIYGQVACTECGARYASRPQFQSRKGYRMHAVPCWETRRPLGEYCRSAQRGECLRKLPTGHVLLCDWCEIRLQ